MGFGVSGLGFRVWGLGFGVWSFRFGFGVQGSGPTKVLASSMDPPSLSLPMNQQSPKPKDYTLNPKY